MDFDKWSKYLNERDLRILNSAGYGAHAGFGKRPALLVIDVSWAFCGDKPESIFESIKSWPNSCGQESWDAIAILQPLLDTFRSKKLPVIYTTGMWRDDQWDMGSWQWKNSRVAEMSEAPAAPRLDPNEIVTAIAPQPQDLVVLKQKPSGFFGTNLSAYLTLLQADSVIIAGGTTSGCVRATVVDAFSQNYRVAVLEDGCFDRSQTSHAVSLIDMHAKYADVVSTQDAIGFARGLDDGLFPGLPGAVRAR
jgi:nicotinamidase-related amidase